MKWSLLLACLVVGCTSASGPLDLLEDLSTLASSAEEGKNTTAILDVPEGIYDYSTVQSGNTWALVFKYGGVVYSQSSERPVALEPYNLLEKPGKHKILVTLDGTQVTIEDHQPS